MEQGEKRIAVLIDADNVSADYIQFIFDEVSNHGAPTLKRIYGDFTQPRLGKWKTVLLDYSIIPIQQYSYTYGKNSTDSALIIDAMDILYSQNVDGFCIVSSDSDFTRLAARLREAGMTVIGMGERKTPTPFVNACEQFKFLEVLAGSDNNESGPGEEDLAPKSALSPSRPTLSKAITAIIDDVADADGWASLGSVGQRLNTRYPAFDSRNYGFKKLSHLVDSFKRFEVQNRTMPNQHEAQTFIRDTENKPFKSKFADDSKHGKKGKKAGKEAFSEKGKKEKDGGKKKKGSRKADFDVFYDAPYPAGDKVASVAEAMFESVPPAHTYSEPPRQEADTYTAQTPVESAAERARRNGFMTVDEAIALFATNPEATVFMEDEPETDDLEAATPAEASGLVEAQAAADDAAPDGAENVPEAAQPAPGEGPAAALAAETGQALELSPQQGEGSQEKETSKSQSAASETPAAAGAAPEESTQPAKQSTAPGAADGPAVPGAPPEEPTQPAEQSTVPEAAEGPATPGAPSEEAVQPAGQSTAPEATEIPATQSAPPEEPAQPTEQSTAPEAAKTPAVQNAAAEAVEPSQSDAAGETPGEAEPQSVPAEAPAEKPKKRTRRSAKKEEPAAEDQGAQAAEPEPTESKKRSRRSAKKDAEEAADGAPAEKKISDAEPAEAETPKKRARRTTKKAEDAAADAAEPDAPKKRTRRTSAKKDAEETPAENPSAEEPPKKRTRRTKAAAEDESPADETPKKRGRTKKTDDAAASEAEETPKKRTRRSTAKKTEEAAETAGEPPKKRTRRTKAQDASATETDSSELTDVLSQLTVTDKSAEGNDGSGKSAEPAT